MVERIRPFRKKRGRPSKFTPELGKQIVSDLDSGLFLSQVALKNGVHYNTIINWLTSGLKPGADHKLADFAESFIRADIDVERKTLNIIIKAAKGRVVVKQRTVAIKNPDGSVTTNVMNEETTEEGDWRAAAFFLERRYKRWAPPRHDEKLPRENISIMEILDESTKRSESLDELFKEAPPELVDVLERNREYILPLLIPETKGDE